MATDARRFVEAAFEKLTPAKAQEMARSLLEGGGRDQVSKLAHDLLDWSTKTRSRVGDLIDREVKEQFAKSRDRLLELVRREVKAQVKSLGVATRDEVDALKKRVRDLERAAGPAKGGAAKRPAAKRPVKPRTAKAVKAGA